MSDTSISLLDRLRQQPSGDSWQRLVTLYTPLIQGWLRRHGVPDHDVDDLVQEVLGVLVRELPHFQHNQQAGAFRSWLRTVTVHRLRGYWRARQTRPQATGDSDFAESLQQLEDPTSGVSKLWDQDHDRHVMAKLLELIEPEFNATDWKAFRRQVFDGQRPATVAGELGVTVNVALLAKSRVLRRLRQEASGLVD
jgi:RNA polymerase sigma-70 factor (ECF subfamily)